MRLGSLQAPGIAAQTMVDQRLLMYIVISMP
jgi:hypothetical protein